MLVYFLLRGVSLISHFLPTFEICTRETFDLIRLLNNLIIVIDTICKATEGFVRRSFHRDSVDGEAVGCHMCLYRPIAEADDDQLRVYPQI